MGAKSKIEWTDATWNPIRGCSRVSEGCRNCYAEATAARFSKPGQAYEGLAVMGQNGPRWTGKVRLVEEALEWPLRWRPSRIFVNSMSDLFHESVPQEWIARIFLSMFNAPQHIYQILTKRPERMLEIMRDLTEYSTMFAGRPMRHVSLGVSIEDANHLDRARLLRQTPAAVRFISYEPALAPVDFSHHLEGIHWLIVGGESGPHARPFDIEWARNTVAQCMAAGVPCFVKQLGANVLSRNDAGYEGDTPHSWPMDTRVETLAEENYQGQPLRVHLRDRKGGDPSEWPADLRVREFPRGT
jgi:protein gp37